MMLVDARRHLLEKLCVDLGFCLSPEAVLAVEQRDLPDPESFVAAVFEAEGLNAELADRHLYRQVLAIVRNAFVRSPE